MRQHGMRRAGEAVFIDVRAGHEHAADYIGIAAGRSADELVVPKRPQRAQIGIERTYSILASEQLDPVAIGMEPDLLRLRTEQLGGFGPLARLGPDQR